jgi:transposase-like protein
VIGIVQRWRGLRRYRCRECRRTFYQEMSAAERISRFRHARHLRQTRRPRPNLWKRYKLRRHATDLLLFLCLVAIFYVALKYLARLP